MTPNHDFSELFTWCCSYLVLVITFKILDPLFYSCPLSLCLFFHYFFLIYISIHFPIVLLLKLASCPSGPATAHLVDLLSKMCVMYMVTHSLALGHFTELPHCQPRWQSASGGKHFYRRCSVALRHLANCQIIWHAANSTSPDPPCPWPKADFSLVCKNDWGNRCFPLCDPWPLTLDLDLLIKM